MSDMRQKMSDSVATEMATDKVHVRHCILYEFQRGKNAAKAFESIRSFLGEDAVSYDICKFWFKRFKSGDFDVSDKQRCGAPRKYDIDELEQLLAENSAQTQEELAEQLGVTQQNISKRLLELGKIQKEGKWVPHELSQRDMDARLDICLTNYNRQQRKSFLWKIVAGGEKWIFYKNAKRKKSWIDPDQPSTTQPNQSRFNAKVMLSIFWDWKGVLHYELLKAKETLNASHFSAQLRCLSDAIEEKRPFTDHGKRPVVLLHDGAKPRINGTVKNTLLALGWEVLPHPSCSPDLAPTDYHLFRSMQDALADSQFETFEDVRKFIDDFIASKDSTFFADGMHMLPDRWLKVIDSDGKYFN